LTIQVLADGSGEYFREAGGTLTTVLVQSDGAGEYLHKDPDSKTTVVIAADGSGALFDEQLNSLLTVTANADRSGEYYFTSASELGTAETVEVTVLARSDGSWQLTDQNAERRIELSVNSDGSGTFARRSRDPLVFDFDANRRGASGTRAVQIVLPEPPEFTVDSAFPALGRFGALSPPCATVLRFDAQLLFDFAEAEIRPGNEETLDNVVQTLNDIGKAIEINGHTDSTPRSAHRSKPHGRLPHLGRIRR
jgi:outer membrane protein OmpA-like peptidoglycan-associated protein